MTDRPILKSVRIAQDYFEDYSTAWATVVMPPGPVIEPPSRLSPLDPEPYEREFQVPLREVARLEGLIGQEVDVVVEAAGLHWTRVAIR